MTQKEQIAALQNEIASLKNTLAGMKPKAKVSDKPTKEDKAKAADPKDFKVIEYSEKSILVYGNGTRCHTSTLRDMGGRFNARFRVNDEIVAGWILPKSKAGTMAKVKKALLK